MSMTLSQISKLRASFARAPLARLAVLGMAGAFLAGCNAESGRYPARAYAPIPSDTLALMASQGATRSSPVLIRAYKKESEIEVWKQNSTGQYALIKTYPICRWSGQLGPKKREGDRQVPEGFYQVTSAQMNPNSAYWLSFNVGYPNPMERAMGRNGGDIMVHGTCSSRGCFAMTNEQIEEIYAVMRESLNGGQKAVQFQSYPFRMTAENLAKFRHDPNMPFWKNLKEGSDHFEVTKQEPKVAYCGGKYVFDADGAQRLDPTGACPAIKTDESIAQAVAAKDRQDQEKVAELVSKGVAAVRVQYADGGQHMSYRTGRYAASASSDDRYAAAAMTPVKMASMGDISRPEAVDAVEEYAVDERGQRKQAPVAVAQAEPAPLKAPVEKSAVAKAAPAKSEPAKAVASHEAGKAPRMVATAQPAAPVAAAAPVSAAALAPAPAPSGAFSAIGSLFGSRSEGGVASASAAPAKAGESEGRPFYKRWLGVGADEQASAPVSSEPAQPQPIKAPLPPRRQAKAPDAPPQRQASLQQ
ncbi:L,D-transpeptidase family protein [Alsobacter sp. KACC 23698]|uniref:L,D-transpeptidase family protein n=1 Tax=Alsobacter sp. KACC 23698 TaxID=3149229 RepID=A0AAU7JD47_9HYPH